MKYKKHWLTKSVSVGYTSKEDGEGPDGASDFDRGSL